MLAKMLANVGKPCKHRDVGENVGERGQTMQTSRCWRKCWRTWANHANIEMLKNKPTFSPTLEC